MPSEPPAGGSERPPQPHRNAGAPRSNAVLFASALALLVIAVVVSAGYYYVIRSSEERTRAGLAAAAADTTNRYEQLRAELHRKSLLVERRPHLVLAGDPRMIRYNVGMKSEMAVRLRNVGNTTALNVRVRWAFGTSALAVPADLRNVYTDSLRDTAVIAPFQERLLHLFSADTLSRGDSVACESGERSLLIFGYVTCRDSIARPDTLKYCLRYLPQIRTLTDLLGPPRNLGRR